MRPHMGSRKMACSSEELHSKIFNLTAKSRNYGPGISENKEWHIGTEISEQGEGKSENRTDEL